MGPSCGGFTCNFAPFRLLSTIQDTRSARPCPNSGVSTPAATFRVGGGVGAASATAVELTLNCAAPAASTDVPESSESPVPPDARLSAAPAPASVVAAGAAAPPFTDAATVPRGTEIAGAGIAGPFGAAAPGGLAPVTGVAESSFGDADESAACTMPASPGTVPPVAAADIAAAVSACALASVLAEAPVFVDGGVGGAVLPSAVPVGPEAAELIAAVAITVAGLPAMAVGVPAGAPARAAEASTRAAEAPTRAAEASTRAAEAPTCAAEAAAPAAVAPSFAAAGTAVTGTAAKTLGVIARSPLGAPGP